MRNSFILRELHTLVSVVHDVGVPDILKKVKSPNVSTLLEDTVKLWSRGVVSEDLCRKLRSLSWCIAQGEENLVDDGLDYLKLQELY